MFITIFIRAINNRLSVERQACSENSNFRHKRGLCSRIKWFSNAPVLKEMTTKSLQMKKILTLAVLFLVLTSFSILMRSAVPPQGYTGAAGRNCTSCHGGAALNSGGGTISLSGLPSGGFSPGTAYDFSLQITHGTSDRRRFGFSIEARNSAGQKAGSFSSTNPNAGNNGDELSQLNAPLLAAGTGSFTYANLRWTAPELPAAADSVITFYFSGIAGSGSGSSDDFTYGATRSIQLLATQTFTFNGSGNWSNPSNWSSSRVPPTSMTGTNARIIIDPPTGAECVLDVPLQVRNGAVLEVKEGKKFRVNGNLDISN
jgi:hypothetical protein